MANPFLGQILGSVLGGAMGGRSRSGPFGGGLGGMGGGRGALLAVLLPLAMRWVQRNGGVGNVLQRVRQKGYGQHATSWVSTGENEALDSGAVNDIVGHEELSRLSQQLGVGEDEVAGGFAEILPEMVDQLTPEGALPPDADDRLDGGLSALQEQLGQLERR